MLKVRSSTRARLLGVAFLMAFAAGCGGGGGGEPDPGPAVPPPPPAGPVAPAWGGAAAVVLGQTGFDQTDPTGTPATPFKDFQSGSFAVASDNRLLVLSDNQVSFLSAYDLANGPVADFQMSRSQWGFNNLRAISTQGSRLVLAADNKVMIYNSTPADESDTPVSDLTVGDGLGDCSATSFTAPSAAYLTPAGDLIVADTPHSRVMIWKDVLRPGGPQAAADVVLGQQVRDKCEVNDRDGDGTSDITPNEETMAAPRGVWSDGTRLVVADVLNNRILIWTTMPSADAKPADVVIGQEDFEGRFGNRAAEPSGATLHNPYSVDVSAAGELAVVDQQNNRVLVWRSIPERNGQAADFVLGQADFIHVVPNDADGTGVSGARPGAKTLANPMSVRFHGNNLIVADNDNDRVMVWRRAN